MEAEPDILSHFGMLDELIQVIYQGASRFVIISEVDDVQWTVHIGLSGDNARWWRGKWSADDIRKVAGSHTSGKALGAFADRLANAFVQGDLYIGNWSPNTTKETNLTIGTAAKAPMHIDLHELSPQEAATFSVRVFTSIALQAQSRKCQLHPTGGVQPPSAVQTSDGKAEEEIRRLRAELEKATRQAASSTASTSDVGYKRKAEEAEEEVHTLKTQLATARAGSPALDSSKLRSKTVPAAVPARKGASLANPTRKARKYQALEFDDDGE
ncbi:hypothetical protein OBBRIDRAFT_726699 [Obba rivulosa]|uniref:Uncharacterized protein n=1 Tax=Obba rivulosa TaxID=1052685 RepID=A0A8E2AY70_9APHY|nr:hypothetical protein OBBRIDRAFT_726699 [Obba rivulosa]